MKKLISICLTVMVSLLFAACGNGSATQSNQNQIQAESSAPANGSSNSDKKILIAYFSHSGNTEAVAQQIHDMIGGDIVKIETVNPYPSDYHECTEVAKAEKDSNARPQLSTVIDNMNDYDTIFIGYPIWWHTAPMAIGTFLEGYDLSGKTIVPFCTSGGSDISESMPMIKELCQKAAIKEGLTASKNDVEKTKAWLQKLGYVK